MTEYFSVWTGHYIYFIQPSHSVVIQPSASQSASGQSEETQCIVGQLNMYNKLAVYTQEVLANLPVVCIMIH